MTLNDIRFSADQIRALYGDMLVGDENALPRDQKPADIPANPSPKELRSLGNNRRNISVFVKYPGISFLPDATLQFLTGILQACKLSIDDIALVNLAETPDPDYRTLIASYKPVTVLMFGIEPAAISLPVNFPEFQAQQFSSITFLHGPSLEELSDDKLLKSKLWVSLKKIFNL